MNLFKKSNNNQNQTNPIDEVKKEIQALRKDVTKIITQKDNFMYDLLCEKGSLEKLFFKEQTQREEAEQRYKKIEQKLMELTKSFDAEILELQKKVTEWKTKATLSSNSVGGLRKQKNRLSKKIEQQNVYIKFLSYELDKSRRIVPTMKQLLEYEHTRKSPLKKVEGEN